MLSEWSAGLQRAQSELLQSRKPRHRSKRVICTDSRFGGHGSFYYVDRCSKSAKVLRFERHSNVWVIKLSFRISVYSSDYHYLLSRSERVTLFKLLTVNNRLNHHLFPKFRKYHSELCLCQTGSMTTEHLLLAGPLHENLSYQFWPAEMLVAWQLFSSMDDV